jgi:hypothetical protein
LAPDDAAARRHAVTGTLFTIVPSSDPNSSWSGARGPLDAELSTRTRPRPGFARTERWR